MTATPRAEQLRELLRLNRRRALGHLLHALGIDRHPQSAEYLGKRRALRQGVERLPAAQRLGADPKRDGSLALGEPVLGTPALEQVGELGRANISAALRVAALADLPDDSAEGEVGRDNAPGKPVAQGAVSAAKRGGGFGIAVATAGAPLAQHRGEFSGIHPQIG
jgi:hypothetical protein